MEDARRLPVIIVRPSIIGAMWRDPLPGWTDNYNGPTGIFAAVGFISLITGIDQRHLVSPGFCCSGGIDKFLISSISIPICAS